jgi:hypothetical protein
MSDEFQKHMKIVENAFNEQEGTTIAQVYNQLVNRYAAPLNRDDLKVDDYIDNYTEIDETVFQKSEYLGGMAAILLELTKEQMGR